MLAKYIRLSDQDDDCRPGEKLESNSIANQRALLDHFIANDPELAGCYALEFIDDGHTGTNFARPGVQALFTAVRRGKVDCIIVKDLSRFGRDSLEVGKYLERLFPLLQVRFIAVNDGYDSRKKQYGAAGDLDIGVRNLINELYSRNVSVNVRTAKRQYAARGECIAAYPFFGYVKGAENRRRLEIDPPAAETVRRIFSLWLDGCSISDIAGTLNAQDVPSPSIRKQQLGVKREKWSKLRETVPWNTAAVRVILQNERYTGKLISLRTVRQEIGNAEQKPVPKKDWIVVPGAFEPIISEETFQKAQGLFRTAAPRAPHTGYAQTLFSRKIYCGVCGLGLSRQKTLRPSYRCREPRGPNRERCKAVRVFEDDLKAYVLAEIHDRALTYADGSESKAADADVLQNKVAEMERQIEKHWSAKKDAFVKMNDGLISREEYENISAEKRREIQRLRSEIESLEYESVSGQQPESTRPDKLAETASAGELTREMVDALIQAVRVFDDGRIEIEWNEKVNIGSMEFACC